MSGILTNNSAMVALQTLNGINRNLNQVQDQISTGLKVGKSKDNAAVFAISQVMRSDVKGFEALSESLSLGESTVAVASNAAKAVGEMLNEIKGKIISASEENVDRSKLQDEIDSLSEQIGGIVGAAQFNGLNLLSNSEQTEGSGTTNVLSSLDRAGDGTVTTSSISVAKQDLGQGAAVIGTTAVAAASDQLTGAINGTATAMTGGATPASQSLTVDSTAAGAGFTIAITASAGTLALNTASTGDISYVARDGESAESVAAGIAAAFNDYVAANAGDSASTIAATVDGATVTFTGSSVTGDNFSINAQEIDAAENTIGGGLEGLTKLDVSSQDGAAAALTSIEKMIQTTIDAQATLGTSEKRLEIQNDFMGKLIDSFKSGIGTLVDADLEEASARLQSLQVQQQLGTQALSIANQAPQSILSLFR